MNKVSEVVDLQASPMEELVQGLQFQWIFNRRGIAFYAEHTTRPLVDAWFNKTVEVARDWHGETRLLILNDFSGKDCMVTPYNQAKNRELRKMFPDFPTASTMVVKQNLTMQLSRLFVRMLPEGNMRLHMTFDRDDALRWLKNQLEQSN